MLITLCLLGAEARAQSLGVQVDPLTGIAIDGYDPVTYFTDGEPQAGLGDYELVVDGIAWHFVSEANREIFRRSPLVYTPQYGGRGAMGLARGYVSSGNPRIFTLYKQRLYFFYSAANREAFLQAPEQAAYGGLTHWQDLSR